MTSRESQRGKEDSSSDSEGKMAAKPLSFCKRKSELLEGAEPGEKRKKGRPRKDKMAAAPTSQVFQPVGNPMGSGVSPLTSPLTSPVSPSLCSDLSCLTLSLL